MEELERVLLFDLPAVERLPSLSKLRKLKDLDIRDMPRLREIQGTADLKSLEQIYIVNCPSLETLDIRRCTKLTPQHISALESKLPNIRIMGPHKKDLET
ncbi:unnamed protein product [Linum tenue]|nr:unnamed protein product [Linum tenue]